MKPKMDPTDRKLLDEVLRASQTWEEEHDEEDSRFRVSVFRSWAELNHALSDKQRRWLHDVYEKIIGVPQYENLVSEGKAPRGREVPLMVKDHPLRPPQRLAKSTGGE